MIENRNGLVVATSLSQATGTAEREAALQLMKGATKTKGTTLAADKSYDTKEFVADCREAGITPHVAAKKKYSAIDGRTTRHIGYEISQRKRKLSEQIFGWAKTVGATRKLRFIGVGRCSEQWIIAMTGFNLVRMAKLIPE